MKKGKKLAIITCCLDDWGGSEELWARSIDILRNDGITDITIFKNEINTGHPEFAHLKSLGIHLKELTPRLSLLKNIQHRLSSYIHKIGEKLGISVYYWNKPVKRLYDFLKKDRPDLVLISQGINFDGLAFAQQCLKLHIPYVIVSHKAVDFFWPASGDREYMKETLLKAKKCLFVSEHNRTLTEEQFGIRLPDSGIVINPVKTTVLALPYPETTITYRLACVGRLFVIDKGQDILLRILSRPKWKTRNISISFIGQGPDEQGLIDLASLLGVDNVSFSGFKTALTDIWANHHALILPSRSEGLPLTVIEAMSLGRMVIATNVGGNAEIIEDEYSGFIAEANEKDFENAMERAWNRRGEWESMGIKASEVIKDKIPESPEKYFATLLKDIINEH